MRNTSTKVARRKGIPTATAGSDAIALQAVEAGEPILSDQTIAGSFEGKGRALGS